MTKAVHGLAQHIADVGAQYLFYTLKVFYNLLEDWGYAVLQKWAYYNILQQKITCCGI